MLQAIKRRVKDYNWKTQKVWKDDDTVQIPSIIGKIENGDYSIKELDLDLEIYNLRTDSFSCEDLFEFCVHYQLVQNADLKYPVIINCQGQVVDGRHRICKAILQWKKTIKAIQVLDDYII